MKLLMVGALVIALLTVGCGVKEEFVQQQIQDSEARTNAAIGQVSDKTEMNAAEIEKLRGLAQELSEKTDLALNKAKGFENYQIIWQGEINYDFDSYDVNATAEQILNDAGQKMEQYPGSVIEFVGHTDKIGSDDYNLMLGEARSASAKRYLSERFGISLFRMFTVSFGENKPVALPDEKDANSKNRRVAMTVWGEL
jgi:outer membrane protein OmpA-like peptidoglycan-associated protein